MPALKRLASSDAIARSADIDRTARSASLKRFVVPFTGVGALDPATAENGGETRTSTEEIIMSWVAPSVSEICVGMEVTSYESADAGTLWHAPQVAEICVGMEVTSYESADAGVEF